MSAAVSQGLICYKPVHKDGCFLRKMEQSDYDNVHSLLQEPAHEVTGSDVSVHQCVVCHYGFTRCSGCVKGTMSILRVRLAVFPGVWSHTNVRTGICAAHGSHLTSTY